MPGGEAGPCAALSVETLSVSREGRRVLDHVSFALEAGRVLGILGPSGAGKSTLLSLIAGFEPADAGRVLLDGRDAATLSPVARGVGVAFDDASLHETLDVLENLESAAAPMGEPRRERRARVEALAEGLGLAALLARRPPTLSAGERRRVAVARVLARRPRVALLDEPFANLDRANRLEVRRLVRALRDDARAATVVVTHDPTDALAIADDLLVLVDGRVRAHGPAQAVWSRPPDLEVAQLVDDLGMTAVPLEAAALSDHFASTVAARLGAAGVDSGVDVRLGVRPARWHPAATGGAVVDAVRIEAVLDAHEPAGLATDLVGRCGDAPFRARLDARVAQELPTKGRVALAAHEEDVHLFAGAWPSPRLS